MSLYDKKDLKSLDWFTILLVFALVGFGLIALLSVLATPFDGSEKGMRITSQNSISITSKGRG